MKLQYIQTNTDGVIENKIRVSEIQDLRYQHPVVELELTPEVALELKRELENKLASIPL